MSTRLLLLLFAALALALSACCTTPEDRAAIEPADGGTVTAAGWESGIPVPPERTGLPRIGTMTTPGIEPLSPRERQDETESLRRANKNLMDRVAKLMSDLDTVKSSRMPATVQPAPKPALEPAPAAPAPDVARIDMARVKSLLRRTGAGDLVVTENHDRLVVIRLNGSMAFASGKAVLTPAARAKIRQIGSAISRELRGIRIRVEGHTDSDPIRKSKWASNEALSLARAGAVAGYFAQVSGIGSDRIETFGYGSTRPIAPNTSREGKAKNRRVELVLVQ